MRKYCNSLRKRIYIKRFPSRKSNKKDSFLFCQLNSSARRSRHGNQCWCANGCCFFKDLCCHAPTKNNRLICCVNLFPDTCTKQLLHRIVTADILTHQKDFPIFRKCRAVDSAGKTKPM